MKIAAIDLGTNTFHLIIGEKNDNGLIILHKENHPVKLGENITLENKIIPIAFERGLNCLIHFKEVIQKYEVDKVKIAATSTVRTASNGKDFIQQVKEKTGLDIQMIEGEQEAELIYQGVRASGVIEGKSMIMDIGGGSTEFIFCDENQKYWKRSFEVGAARLMQQFFKSDPVNSEHQQAIEIHLEKILQPVIDYAIEFKPTSLIGSAGAFETYTMMLKPDFDLNQSAFIALSLIEYQKLSVKLIQSNHQERSLMPNLIPLRVDMIVMASLLTNFIISKTNIQKIKMTTYDLKMGLLIS